MAELRRLQRPGVLPADAQRKAYSTLHLFGTATDNGSTPTGGDFLLTFADGTTETATVRFRDWAAPADAADDHPAIVTNPRYTTSGTQGNINFYIYHRGRQISEANRGKVLTSIKLPPSATPGGTNAEAYLMAITLEDATGGFELPRLAANAQFPNDETPPATTATSTRPRRMARRLVPAAGRREARGGRRGGRVAVDGTEYRIDGGAWLSYTAAGDGRHRGRTRVQYRAIDRAGNLESQQAVAVNIDSAAPEVEAAVAPDCRSASTGTTARYSSRSTPSTAPAPASRRDRVLRQRRRVAGLRRPGRVQRGRHLRGRLPGDRPGRQHSAAGEAMTVRVDRTAPVTTVLLDGAAPAGAYAGPCASTWAPRTARVRARHGVPRRRQRLDGVRGGVHRGGRRPAPGRVPVRRRGRQRRTGAPGRVHDRGRRGARGAARRAEPAPEPAPWAALGRGARSRSTGARSGAAGSA